MNRKKKDWDVETLLSIVGFVFELIRVVVNALRRRGGTIDHLRRLLKDPVLVDKVFDLIVDQTTEIFRVKVEYGPSVIQRFGSAFDHGSLNEEIVDKEVESCQGVSRENREVVFEYVCLGRLATEDEAIAEMIHRGLRPALIEEGLCFAKQFPNEQRKFDISIIGSILLGPRNSYRTTARLRYSELGRQIQLAIFRDGRFEQETRFLAVRE